MSAQLDGHRYLFLTSLSEPADNVLLLRLEEGRVPDTPEGADGHMGRPILVDVHCAAYDVLFPTYAAYAVRNESYTTANDDEVFEGAGVRTYTRSRFLDFVHHGTFALGLAGDPYRHTSFVCVNHIVDIVSQAEPQVRQVRAASSAAK